MNEHVFEQIEAYLAGSMTEAQKSAFEQQMNSDSSLAEEVKLQQETHTLVNLTTTLSYKDKLKAFDKELTADLVEEAPKVIPFWKNARVWLAAATILIAVSALLFSQLRYGPNAYSQSFSVYQDVTGLRSNDTLTTFRTAMSAYNRAQYDIAIRYLNQHLESKKEDSEAWFYLGNSYLAQEEYKKGLQALKKVDPSSKYHEAASWYQALAYGFNKQEEEAINILENIKSEPTHGYQQKADKLLKEIQ